LPLLYTYSAFQIGNDDVIWPGSTAIAAMMLQLLLESRKDIHSGQQGAFLSS